MLEKIKQTALPDNVAALLIPHIDLTLLEEAATRDDIVALCEKATTPKGPVAAVCVFAQHVPDACGRLSDTAIKVATVANFHQGETTLMETCRLIEQALHQGADEIDLVLPYKLFLSGEVQKVERYLAACEKVIHPRAHMKVILETGALQTPNAINEASKLAIHVGTDFLKTSTGKIPVGATLEAALTMLTTIKQAGAPVGFKASGGVRTPKEAYAYFCLTEHVLEKTPDVMNFRLGASRLLDELLALT